MLYLEVTSFFFIRATYLLKAETNKTFAKSESYDYLYIIPYDVRVAYLLQEWNYRYTVCTYVCQYTSVMSPFRTNLFPQYILSSLLISASRFKTHINLITIHILKSTSGCLFFFSTSIINTRGAHVSGGSGTNATL